MAFDTRPRDQAAALAHEAAEELGLVADDGRESDVRVPVRVHRALVVDRERALALVCGDLELELVAGDDDVLEVGGETVRNDQGPPENP